MQNWQAQLKYDPIPPLLDSGDEALVYFTRRDLLGEDPGPVERLRALPGALRILKKQLADGSWPRQGEVKHPAINYGLIETWRWFRFLVYQYGFTRQHPAAERAAEFLFSCQTDEGDFRGILANQYATYYSGALLALLVKAGYVDEPPIHRAFQWLLEMRQDDGGWTVPILTRYYDWKTVIRLTSQPANPVEPDRSQPFSHNWTGMVLRAFAAHPDYRNTRETWRAAGLYKSRFFQKDVYTSYQSADYWLRFDYPFWWNSLVAGLDSLAQIGLPADDPDIRRGLDWLVEHQEASGLWAMEVARANKPGKDTPQAREKQLWVGLAICRILKRLLIYSARFCFERRRHA